MGNEAIRRAKRARIFGVFRGPKVAETMGNEANRRAKRAGGIPGIPALPHLGSLGIRYSMRIGDWGSSDYITG